EGGLISVDPPPEHNKNLIFGVRVAPDQVTIPTQRRRLHDKYATRARVGRYCRFSVLRVFQHRDAEVLLNQELSQANLDNAIRRLLFTRRTGKHLPAQGERQEYKKYEALKRARRFHAA